MINFKEKLNLTIALKVVWCLIFCFYNFIFIKNEYCFYASRTYILLGLLVVSSVLALLMISRQQVKTVKNLFRTELQGVLLFEFIMTTALLISPFKYRALIGLPPNFLSYLYYTVILLFLISVTPVLDRIWTPALYVASYVSLACIGLIIIYQYYINDFLTNRTPPLLYFAFGNSNYACEPFAIMFLFMVLPYFYKKRFNYLELGIALFFFNISVITFSRGSFVAVVGSIGCSLLFLLFKKVLNIKQALVIILLMGIIVVANLSANPRLQNKFATYGTILKAPKTVDNIDRFSSGRVEPWLKVWNYFKSDYEKILVGIGGSTSVFFDGVNLINMHNQYLEMFVTGGIFVFILFILFVGRLLKYAWTLVMHDYEQIYLWGCLIYILVKWLFNSLNAMNSSYLLLVFALILHKYHAHKLKTNSQPAGVAAEN